MPQRSASEDSIWTIEPEIDTEPLKNPTPHRKRARQAVKIIFGSLWLLGIALGLATGVVLLVLAAQTPLTLPLLGAAGAVAVGLPLLFLQFPYVRARFLQRLDSLANWFFPDPKPLPPSPLEASVLPLSKEPAPENRSNHSSESVFIHEIKTDKTLEVSLRSESSLEKDVNDTPQDVISDVFNVSDETSEHSSVLPVVLNFGSPQQRRSVSERVPTPRNIGLKKSTNV